MKYYVGGEKGWYVGWQSMAIIWWVVLYCMIVIGNNLTNL
jgi:hypothetical protein